MNRNFFIATVKATWRRQRQQLRLTRGRGERDSDDDRRIPGAKTVHDRLGFAVGLACTVMVMCVPGFSPRAVAQPPIITSPEARAGGTQKTDLALPLLVAPDDILPPRVVMKDPLQIADGAEVGIPIEDSGDAAVETVIASGSDLPAETKFQYSTGFRTHAGGSPYAEAVQYDPSVPEEDEAFIYRISEGFLDALSRPEEPMSHFFEKILHAEHDEPHTKLDSHAIGIQPIPPRPNLLLEWNEEFLAPGFLEQGVCIPTGAVWRPSLWVFGTFRTGVNYFDSGAGAPVVEWANRLDLFSQLNLSGTERLLFGIRPLDEEQGARRDFTGYDFRNGDELDGWNGDVQTLFFEGDFGEIFPKLDWFDTRALDIGFSVGRQPMLFQQGLLLNEDSIDALTVTRNTLYGNGNLNMRGTFVYAWNAINRHNLDGGNINDGDGQLVGLFTESDLAVSTVNADVVHVWSDNGVDDLTAIGISSIRRISGHHNTYNSSLHFLASFPTNGETNLAGQGELLFSQLSWTPHHTHDLIFLNTFWGIDQFTSASRGTLAGGPLGQAGLLFSAAGLGRYGAPLSNQASNVVGGSLGYQMFFDHTHQQLTLEIGGRQDTDGVDQAAIASGLRYQRALDQHCLVVVDAFVTKREGRDVGQGAQSGTASEVLNQTADAWVCETPSRGRVGMLPSLWQHTRRPRQPAGRNFNVARNTFPLPRAICVVASSQIALETVLKLVRWLSKAVEFRHRRPWKAIVPVKIQSQDDL